MPVALKKWSSCWTHTTFCEHEHGVRQCMGGSRPAGPQFEQGMGLRRQLIQWGFVKQEIRIDDGFNSVHIGSLLVVRVTNKDDSLQCKWADTWADWTVVVNDRAGSLKASTGRPRKFQQSPRSSWRNHGRIEFTSWRRICARLPVHVGSTSISRARKSCSTFALKAQGNSKP